jgi:tetratricopeptide (TPR) repeat protein
MRWGVVVILGGLSGACATTAAPPAAPPASAASTRQQPSVAGDDGYLQKVDDAAKRLLQSDAEGALRLGREATEMAPARSEAYTMTGLAYYALGKPDSAAPEFKRAIELASPDKKEAFLNMIRSQTSAAASDEEKDLLKRAFDATEAHHPADALPLLRRALDLNARNAHTRYEIGYALVDLGRVDEAIPQFEESRRINPVAGEVLGELQYCYSERKRFVELRGVVSDRILVEGESPALLQELAFALAVSGESATAISTLEGSLRRFPDFYPSRFSLGQLYCEAKDVTRGHAELDAFLSAAHASTSPSATGKPLMRPDKLEGLVHDAESLRASCGH